LSDVAARRLALPALCLVTDRHLCGEHRLAEVVAATVAGGATMVQLREKDLPAGELYALGRQLRPLATGRCALVVNDRLDVALACRADGVQLGATALPLAEARRLGGPALLLGRSVHSVAEAIAAEREGADFLILGTIYATRSHPGQAPAGPGLVASVRAAVRLPIIAIGGIDRSNLAEVMAAGADGVAVISALLAAPDPRASAASLAAALEAGWHKNREKA